MRKSRYTEEQIAYALRQAELGTPVDITHAPPELDFAKVFAHALERVVKVILWGPWAPFQKQMEENSCAAATAIPGIAKLTSPGVSMRLQ